MTIQIGPIEKNVGMLRREDYFAAVKGLEVGDSRELRFDSVEERDDFLNRVRGYFSSMQSRNQLAEHYAFKAVKNEPVSRVWRTK